MREAGASVQDIAAFELLGERQQSISGGVDLIIKDLGAITSVLQQLATLKADLARTFEAHRRLAMENADLLKDKERAEQGLREKSAQHDVLAADLRIAKASLEEASRNLEKARTDLESLENRYHVLGVAKKEADELLQRVQSQLQAAHDEVSSLERDVAGLREHSENQAARIVELSEKYNETNSKFAFLSNRCEILEAGVQEKTVEIVGLRELVDLLTQEKESSLAYGRQKEQEATQARTEASRSFQQGQQDKKVREIEIGKLRIELDTVRSNLKTHEDIGAEMRIQCDKLTADLAYQEDRNKTLEAANSRLEAQVARMSAKLDSTMSAKSQIEQSRAVISARLDTLTQAIAEREADVRRLEKEVATLSIRNEEQTAMSGDAIEALNSRIFELEKELTARQNESAFYASQLDAIQRQGGKLQRA